MITKVKLRKGELLLDAELGLRANCRGPEGSDMPRAPWSSLEFLLRRGHEGILIVPTKS